MDEQMGWRALVRNVREQAPFWAEKLPEMPGLLYDTLQEVRRGSHTQKEWAEKFIEHQRKAAISRWWSLLAASLTVSAAMLVYASDIVLWPVVAGFAAAFSWLQAWVRKP
ncbi:hypothetical protein VT06_17330 [Arsukibacterium sp. MJ3]|nr:hypothetical protein VT06_17330 [Arsukibacterium sp. MJ3]